MANRQAEIKKAVLHFEAVVKENPLDALAHHNLAAAYHRDERLEDALQAYNEAIALRPQWGSPHAQMGFVLKDLGDINGSALAYETAVELDPNDAISCYNLGVLYFNQGRLEDAGENTDLDKKTQSTLLLL